MAILNFKVTESDAPGGGVCKIGQGNRIQINQADYHEYNLASMTEKNFFKKTVCLSNSTGAYNDVQYTNVITSTSGGSTKIKYDFYNGVGTITVEEVERICREAESDFSTYTHEHEATSGYTHEIYMCKEPIREG